MDCWNEDRRLPYMPKGLYYDNNDAIEIIIIRAGKQARPTKLHVSITLLVAHRHTVKTTKKISHFLLNRLNLSIFAASA